MTCPELFGIDETPSLMPRLELDRDPKDFPVETFFRDVRVDVDSRGGFIINKGSRAFILWRGRTPTYIPDSAFAFHYLTPEQIRYSVNRKSLVDAVEKGLLSPDILEREPQVASNALAQVERMENLDFSIGWLGYPESLKSKGLYSFDVLIRNMTRKKLTFSETKRFLYVFDRQTGQHHLVFMDSTLMSHTAAAALIESAIPEAHVEFGGMFQIYGIPSRDRYKVKEIAMTDRQYGITPTVEGISSLERLLDAFNRSFRLDDNVTVSEYGAIVSWPGLVPRTGVQLGELRNQLIHH